MPRAKIKKEKIPFETRCLISGYTSVPMVTDAEWPEFCKFVKKITGKTIQKRCDLMDVELLNLLKEKTATECVTKTRGLDLKTRMILSAYTRRSFLTKEEWFGPYREFIEYRLGFKMKEDYYYQLPHIFFDLHDAVKMDFLSLYR